MIPSYITEKFIQHYQETGQVDLMNKQMQSDQKIKEILDNNNKILNIKTPSSEKSIEGNRYALRSKGKC